MYVYTYIYYTDILADAEFEVDNVNFLLRKLF